MNRNSLHVALLGMAFWVGTGVSVQADDTAPQPASAEAPVPAAPDSVKPTDAAEPDGAAFFASIQKKMAPEQVLAILGAPTRILSGQSGKGWVPFYHGSDLNRVYWSYQGRGIVIFSENAYRGSLAVFDVRLDANAP